MVATGGREARLAIRPEKRCRWRNVSLLPARILLPACLRLMDVWRLRFYAEMRDGELLVGRDTKKFAKQPHAKHLSIWFSQKEVLAMLGISVPVICCHQLMPSSLLSRHEMSTFLRRIDVIHPKIFLTTEGLEFPAIVGEWRRKTHRPAHFLHT
jgi:hypothetical protein